MFKNKKIIIIGVIFVLVLFLGMKLFIYITEPRGVEISLQTLSLLEEDLSKFIEKNKPKESTSKFGLGGGGPAMGDPSCGYCSDLGYKHESRENSSACVFPDGSECGTWDFYTGKCGQEFTVCGQLGIKVENDTTVGDSYSQTRASCFFNDGKCGAINFAKVWSFLEDIKLSNRTKKACSVKVPKTVDLTAIKVYPNSVSDSVYTEVWLPLGFRIDSYPFGEDGYYIIQLDGFMHQEEKDKIESSGGVIYDSIPEHAFIIKMNEGSKKKIQELEFVKWVGIYNPVYKMKPNLIDIVFVDKPTLTITIFEGENTEKIANQIRSLGGFKVTVFGSKIETQIDLSKILSIANITGVRFIEKNTK